ncbi:MAG: hypothetical protein IR153_07865 [Flavobacterium sp.]|nr:hypothetical protein [Flavobacterium sp.]
MTSSEAEIKSEILEMIADSNSLRKSREYCARFFCDNQQYLNILFDCAFDVDYDYHYKACWILEFVADLDLSLLSPRIPDLCNALSKYSHDGALRSIGRICLLLCQKNYRSAAAVLSNDQAKIFTDVSFAWLLGDSKVATKAYAMRILALNSKTDKSVVIPLKDAIEHGYPNHSAAYKAAAKDVLRQLSRDNLLS